MKIKGSSIVRKTEEHRRLVSYWGKFIAMEVMIANSARRAALKDAETRHVIVEKDFTRINNNARN